MMVRTRAALMLPGVEAKFITPTIPIQILLPFEM